MNCDESFEILYRFIDMDLEGNVFQDVEVHLAKCRGCWDRFEFEKKLKAHIRKCCHQEPLPENLVLRIQKLLDQY